jgi:hypothetical protein
MYEKYKNLKCQNICNKTRGHGGRRYVLWDWSLICWRRPFFDVFNVFRLFLIHFGGSEKEGGGRGLDKEDSLPSALSIVSVRVGALTMVGGQTTGARALIEGVVWVTDLLSNETAWKWAVPVIGAFTITSTFLEYRQMACRCFQHTWWHAVQRIVGSALRAGAGIVVLREVG